MFRREKDLVVAALNTAATLIRELDSTLSQGSVANAREAMQRSQMRSELRSALDETFAATPHSRRSA